jgi:putative transposase
MVAGDSYLQFGQIRDRRPHLFVRKTLCVIRSRRFQSHLRELYAVDVSPDLISRATDAVLDEARESQNGPLDVVYPVIFFDALQVKICDESLVKNKAVYPALALDCEGQKHAVGLWIEQSGGAEFWLRVMNELKTRASATSSSSWSEGSSDFPDPINSVFLCDRADLRRP